MIEDASVFLLFRLLLHEGEVIWRAGVDDVVGDYYGTCFDEVSLLEEMEVLHVV